MDKCKFRRGESRRDSIIQPRVARNELPWVGDARGFNPEGVESELIDTIPLGLQTPQEIRDADEHDKKAFTFNLLL